jgi:hypothetical protein
MDGGGLTLDQVGKQVFHFVYLNRV